MCLHIFSFKWSFLFQMNSFLIIFVSTNFSFVKMILYCLNPNLVLNLGATVVLQSLITLIANFASIKVLLTCFLGFSTSSYLCLLWLELYFLVISHKCLRSNPSLICFHLTTIPHHYYFYTISFNYFSAYINHFYIVYSTEVSGFFISSFIPLYSLKTLLFTMLLLFLHNWLVLFDSCNYYTNVYSSWRTHNTYININ